MEVVRPQSHRNLFSSNDAVSAPTIPLYRSAPPLEVRLEDFESFSIDRLRGTNRVLLLQFPWICSICNHMLLFLHVFVPRV